MTQPQIKKIRILDLFAGTQSVRKALEKDYEIDYVGIDIYSPQEANTIFDLTQDNIVEKLKEVLPKDWKPDFIWASPPCEDFSLANPGKGSGNLHYEVKDGVLSQRTNFYEKGKDNTFAIKSKKRTDVSLKLVYSMIKIINYYNVPFAIENPQRSLIDYLLKDYKRTTTSYCMYGFKVRKNTWIWSSKELKLLKCEHKNRHEQVIAKHKITYDNGLNNYLYDDIPRVNTYAERSMVPPPLIKEIFIQLFEKEGK